MELDSSSAGSQPHLADEQQGIVAGTAASSHMVWGDIESINSDGHHTQSSVSGTTRQEFLAVVRRTVTFVDDASPRNLVNEAAGVAGTAGVAASSGGYRAVDTEASATTSAQVHITKHRFFGSTGAHILPSSSHLAHPTSRAARQQALTEGMSGCQKIRNDMHEMHALGKCVPCFFAMKAISCKRGYKCMFCHGEHPDYVFNKRPAKSIRNRCVRILDKVYTDLTAPETDPHRRRAQFFDAVRAHMAEEDEYMRERLIARLDMSSFEGGNEAFVAEVSKEALNFIAAGEWPEASLAAAAATQAM